MKINEKYHGVVVPMVTPITEKGDIDTNAVERIVENFAQNKVSALIMGTTGEGNSVSIQQGAEMIKTAANTASGRILIYAGLGGTCISEQMTSLKQVLMLLQQHSQAITPLHRNRCMAIIKTLQTT